MIDLSGEWRSFYRYQSSGRTGSDLWGQHTLHVTQDGTQLKAESIPEDPSHIQLDLTVDEKTHMVTGTWRERSDQAGYYKGKVFEGTVSFRLSENGDHMSGVWQGKGSDGEMNSDIWELAKGNGKNPLEELPERWRCTYWFPSNKHAGDEPSGYEMKLYRDGNTLVFESVPNKDQSYMMVRLKVEDTVAIGNWYETTSPTGEFKGALYSGSGQLIIDEKSVAMEGMWAGAGYDWDAKKMKIYTGKWEIIPLS